MAFYIDNAIKGEVKGWRHQLVPGQVLGREQHQFIGVRGGVVVSGTPQPPDIVVTGHLISVGAGSLAQAIEAVNTEFQFWLEKRSQELHDISINGQDFDNVELVDLDFTGDVESLGVNSVRRAVRFHWRQLL